MARFKNRAMTVSLEGESSSKLACERPRNDRARRVDEAEGFEEAGAGVRDVDVVVGPVVGAVGDIESLEEEGDVVAIVNRNGLADSGIKLSEGLTMVGVVGDLAARSGAEALLVEGREAGLLSGIGGNGSFGCVEIVHISLRSFLGAGEDGGVGITATAAYSPEIAGGLNDA